MAKFNTRNRLPQRSRSFIQTTPERAYTHEYGVGYKRDAKSDLFLLAISNMVGEGSFYESATVRDDRFEKLIAEVVAEDPEWMQRFIPWLRNEAFMRSAAIVMAAEYVRAHGPNAARVVDSAIKRADEPAEMVGYWLSKYGRKPGEAVLPFSLKRGVARAAVRVYNEYSAIKYDGQNAPIKFGDVILLTRPAPVGEAQNQLFNYLRYRWVDDDKSADQYDALEVLQAREAMEKIPVDDRRTVLRTRIGVIGDDPVELLDRSGMPWEHLAGWLPGGMDAEAWEFVIPKMGYMALLRNLRNFEQAGISDVMVKTVCDRLSDPEAVAKSMQFPIRFYSAFRNTGSLKWAAALESALNLSLNNVPGLGGKTLILVDRSGSMYKPISTRSSIQWTDISALFGSALALRCESADLVQYGTNWEKVAFSKGSSVLRLLDRFKSMGGTRTLQAIEANFKDHDRVVVLTDEQAFRARGNTLDQVKCPIYTFNLVGYETAMLESGTNNRYTFGGGLTDACFRLLKVLDERKYNTWPF